MRPIFASKTSYLIKTLGTASKGISGTDNKSVILGKTG